jgi:hypothetical protein
MTRAMSSSLGMSERKLYQLYCVVLRFPVFITSNTRDQIESCFKPHVDAIVEAARNQCRNPKATSKVSIPVILFYISPKT